MTENLELGSGIDAAKNAINSDLNTKADSSSHTISTRTGAVMTVGVIATGVLLGACGVSHNNAKPADSEFTSNSTQSQNHLGSNSKDVQSTQAPGDANVKFPTFGADTGTYKDGSYSITGTYGVGDGDTLTVNAEVSEGNIVSLTVTPTASSAISDKYQKDFVKVISGQVVGKPLKDIKADKVAGASWTSEAFNAALTGIRQQASAQG